MKYQHKCPGCNRLATRRFRGRWFCENCQRIARRIRPDFVFQERLVWAAPGEHGKNGFLIYKDIPLPLH